MSTSWFKSLVGRLGGRPKDPAAEARAAQVRAFKAAVARDLDGDRAALEALLRMPTDLGLPDDEIELEVETVQGALDLVALREAIAAQGLPVVEHQHKALGDERCHFRAAAFLANDGGDRTGRLFLTHRRLVFLSTPMVALPWSGILTIDQRERDLIIVPTARETLYQFRCNSFSDARCGAFIAQQLKRGNSGTGADGRRGSR